MFRHMFSIAITELSFLVTEFSFVPYSVIRIKIFFVYKDVLKVEAINNDFF